MDEENLDKVPLDSNLQCNVCGEKVFDLRAGFFYCRECGTAQEQVREIEIDHEASFRDVKHIKTQKLKTESAEKPNLTSWECYNYILRGLVEELMLLGAKEDFKTITLQLWTAYLRRKEVAFFNKKHTELPKLSAVFHKRDANILYNHVAAKSRKRKRDDTSRTSGDSSRDWRKTKRKLDESLYSATTTDNSDTRTSLLSTSSGTTGHAIQLAFSSHARKVFKRQMPAKHIKKHEQDAENILKCHAFPPKKMSLTNNENFVARITIREIYTILAIALNLAEDDIQLCDLVRFIAEGHIGTKNVLQYFPENVIMHGKDILKDISFHRYADKASYRALRDNIKLMAKFIVVQEFRIPNLISLVSRYVTELNLPPEMVTYVERLINLLPPKMQMRSCKIYPAYEARAMAYIIFVLKLLFGLDGFKEKKISTATKKINAEIQSPEKNVLQVHPKLFVWNEWVEYVEMRKVIIAQFNSVYGQQFKVQQTMSQKLEELNNELNSENQNDTALNDGPKDISVGLETMVRNLQQIMTEYQASIKDIPQKSSESIRFQPSFMPSDSYFKRIRLHAALSTNKQNLSTLKIPECMNVDHTLRTLEPFLHANPLCTFLSKADINLRVKALECVENKRYVGMFVSGREFVSSLVRETNCYQADFNITPEKWTKGIVDEPCGEDVTFKTVLDCYEKQYMKKLQSKAEKCRNQEIDATHVETVACHNLTENEIKIENEPHNFDALSMHSIELFSEYNMEPIDGFNLPKPRRNLECTNLLENVPGPVNEDDENDEENEADDDNSLTLLTSKMDCWLLIGHIAELSDLQKKALEDLFPRSFLWLLETCANTIHVDWGVVYDQLMALEITFAYGIKSLEEFRSFLSLKHFNKIKDINVLVNWYREVW